MVVAVPPVVVVPPMPGEDPNPLPVSEPVVAAPDGDELLLNGELEVPPKPELPPPKEDEPEDPKPEEACPDEPKGEEEEAPEEPKPDEPNPDEDEPEDPKPEDDAPNPPLEAVPVPVVVPVVVPVLAPVGVIPPCAVTACPNKPMAGTLASPKWMMRQSSFPVIGSR